MRAGSCVLPLHHPARVAEEWAVIDNLTGGRAGLAIASGWQPDDFVLRPENVPPTNKAAMIQGIDQLRRLFARKGIPDDAQLAGVNRITGGIEKTMVAKTAETEPRPKKGIAGIR